MAPAGPAQPARPMKEQRVKNIISFIADLEARLPAAAASGASTATTQELEKNISSFPENLSVMTASRCEDLDRSGIAIWNLCTRLRREYDTDKPQDVPIVLLLARVYAFLVINYAHVGGRSAAGNLARIMKTGIKAGKSCLECKDFKLAMKVLGKVSEHEATLNTCKAEMKQEERKAWHQSQFDMADHMFGKSISAKQFFTPSTAESLADVLYEIGKGLMVKQQYPMAVKWLERAGEVLDGQELDRLSMDATELRTSILQSLIRALLGLKDAGAIERARGLVDLLQSQVGDKLVVLLLRLELLSAPPADDGVPCDSASYLDVLQRMIRTLALNDGNFKLVMFHIRKLNEKSPRLAANALDSFLLLRVVKHDRDEWFEKALVTRLWIVAGQKDKPESLLQLEELFSNLMTNFTKPASSAATLAAHTLIWKLIESNYSQGKYDVSEKWCRLAMHQIFARSGELNTARISRKLLLCALAKTDIGSAREIFSAMPDTAKSEPMSRFLMYKIAVRCRETELAAECLQLIGSASTKDPKILYACVLEAQQAGDRVQTLAALQLVLERCGYESPSINLPSLLRLTMTLMVQQIDEFSKNSDDVNADALVERLCTVYERGVAKAQKARVSKKEPASAWTIDELHWFSKNSYNLAMKNLANWAPPQMLRLLVCCIGFIDQYPKDINQQTNEDLSLRRMFCDFTAATALVGLARGEDDIEIQLQNYLRVRRHVESFDSQLQKKAGNLEEEAEMDLHQKLAILAAFDFEAACQLKAWDDLGEIILKADACKSTTVYEIMADIVLCSEAPTTILVHTLKKVINEAWGKESIDSAKLAKYIRCLFQITIAEDVELAEQLLDQACGYASEAAESDQPIISEEIEWMATKAFNQAVDFYCGGADQKSKDWADKALNIAHYCADEGQLERLLQSKLVELKFDS
ncbi:unnamed protein product [Diplocarpon coronariae]|uniref:Protein ZIP4 homolog n=1 Tax=Diplocarpon coronariae TaxID=2795749 RepID=A0A218Z8S8_9HELO|nr:hypothetical protein JHW43_003276 [Diplocarpon mali]OWP04104.1 hypothetical protein B2J93_5925 [Marssonina coronariae]